MKEVSTILNQRIDELEKAMVDNFPVAEGELTHRFFNGFYIREFFMKAGQLWTSKIHKTRHPFVIQDGVVSVWINGIETMIIATKENSYEGITEVGTRRVLYCHTDVRWFTFHLINDGESVEQIEERIIEKHDNLLLYNIVKKENILK